MAVTDLPSPDDLPSPRVGPDYAMLLNAARQYRSGAVALLARPVLSAARAVIFDNATRIAVGAAALGLQAALLASLGRSKFIMPMLMVVVASGFSSIAGFAFSPVTQMFLAPFPFDPVWLVQMLMICSIATQSFAIVSLWREMAWRRLPIYLAGGMLGAPVGVWLLLRLNLLGFHIVIGSLLVAYGGYVLFKRPMVLSRAPRIVDPVIGFLGGITGGVAAFPGAAITIWCGLQGLDKSRQRGTYQPYILAMQLIGLATIALARTPGHGGATGSAVGYVTALLFVPATLIGSWLGLRAFRRISDRGFEKCTASLLVLAGWLMLV